MISYQQTADRWSEGGRQRGREPDGRDSGHFKRLNRIPKSNFPKFPIFFIKLSTYRTALLYTLCKVAEVMYICMQFNNMHLIIHFVPLYTWHGVRLNTCLFIKCMTGKFKFNFQRIPLSHTSTYTYAYTKVYMYVFTEVCARGMCQNVSMILIHPSRCKLHYWL